MWETDVGLNIYDYNYAEVVQAPLQSTETGLLLGIKGGVRYNPKWHRGDGLYFKLNFEYSGSGTSTDRSIQGSTITQVSGNTNNIFADLSLESGLDVNRWDEDNLLSGFAGVGFHWWRRGDGSPINSTTPGYRELYKWPYLEAGPRFFHRIDEKWSVIPEFALVWMPTGSLNVYLSDFNATLQNTSVTLGGTVGFRMAVPIRYRLNELMALTATPWFQYSTIGQSNAVAILNTDGTPNGQVLTEPNSRTYQVGVYFAFSMVSKK